MVEDELDEEEKARRRKESIAWRNQKRTANTFLFLTTLLEIVVTVIIMVALFLIAAKITFSCGDPNNINVQKVFLVLLLIIFFGSLVLGFIVYKWLSRIIIKKMHLEEKLPEDVMMHFRSKKEDSINAELKR